MSDEKIVSYGLKSSSLPFYLSEFISLERRVITIISPTISDFNVPYIDRRFQADSHKPFTFFSALKEAMKTGVKVRTYSLRGGVDEFLDFDGVDKSMLQAKVTEKVHEKYFITSDFFYKGSANLTYHGTYVKIEGIEVGLVKENRDYTRRIIYNIDGESGLYRR